MLKKLAANVDLTVEADRLGIGCDDIDADRPAARHGNGEVADLPGAIARLDGGTLDRGYARDGIGEGQRDLRWPAAGRNRRS